MNVKGNCQHCNGPMEFDDYYAGQSSDCPHCNQSTILSTAPPKARIPVSIPRSIEDKTSNAVIIAGFIFAFLIPLIGFIIGIYLMCNKRFGYGITIMVVSMFVSMLWLMIFGVMSLAASN